MIRGSEYAKLVLENKKRECKKQKEIEEAKCAERKKTNEQADRMYYTRENRIALENRQRHAVQNLRSSLLSEAMYYLLENSLPNGIQSDSKDVMKRNMIDKFIHEHGTVKLLSNFKEASYLLSEYARVIEEAVQVTLEARKKNKCEDTTVIELEDEIKEDFYNNLKTDDAEELTDIVRTRAMNAIDTFMTSNANDKLDIQDIVRQTADKVNSTNKDNIQESYNIQGKRAITDIRNRQSRNVFESMVYNVSRAAFNNEEMKEMFVNENGLNLDSILENVEILYTFLEMVNTSKMIKVDSQYISKMLNGLK